MLKYKHKAKQFWHDCTRKWRVNRVKNPRFETGDDLGAWEFPDVNKIPCRDCALREKDHKLPNGKVWEGATYAICEAFGHKPDFILWKGEDCPYYIKED